MNLSRQELINKVKELSAEIEQLRMRVKTSFWFDKYIDECLYISQEELDLVYEELMK